ncbi:hypothetical protein Rhow_007600 [Rhodococcus wratislaviensis]|uniref:Uncharacterized protein n=1 Tax=Rhodococcus wratislaviensis TaxID=44752 RepID=A0A402CIB8_RHOWR|nr:hypothetical protein Rhow_007600 [Rhodococcus wratislaviensis]
MEGAGHTELCLNSHDSSLHTSRVQRRSPGGAGKLCGDTPRLR